MFTRFDENNNNNNKTSNSSNNNNNNSFNDYQPASAATPTSPQDNYGCANSTNTNNSTRSCLEIINDANNDSDTNSVDLSSLADDNENAINGSSSVDLDNFGQIITNNEDKCAHSSKSSNQIYYHHHGHRNHSMKYDHHHHHHHNNDLMNSYCIDNISSPLSSDINSTTNNNEVNNISTCLSSPSQLSSYSPVDLKHDDSYPPLHSHHHHHHLSIHPLQYNDPGSANTNEQLLTKNALSLNSNNSKSSDRNVHCVKEKIRRDRIKYSCNELRRLIPNLNGLKTDMASLLETSVLWIQLINSNIPQEFLDDVQSKLEKLTSAQQQQQTQQQQQQQNLNSYSPPRNAPVPNPILTNNQFKATKRNRKSMSNLNKQMLNEEKLRLIKAQQQHQPSPPTLIPSTKTLMAYPAATLISPASLINTNNVLAAAAVASYHSAIDGSNAQTAGLIDFATTNLEQCSNKQAKMMLLNTTNLTAANNNAINSKPFITAQTNDFPFKCQYLNSSDLMQQQQQQQNTFDYSSNYELYNKLIKKGCQFIDNNINLSANSMHLKLNAKQLTSDFDLPFQNYVQN